jgi:hypothetical protein
MAKGPPVHIVPNPESEAAASAPHHLRPLGEHGQRLWDQITAEFEVEGSPGRDLTNAARWSIQLSSWPSA